jgi:plasmid maintenance system antidote protein VapI
MVGFPTNRAPTHPGTMLNEEFLEPLGITQTEAAKDIRKIKRHPELVGAER